MSNRIDDLRCADQDRELVAQVLNNAYAEGRLTFEEHAERIAHAYDAKTFGDLNSLTADLVAQRRPVAQPVVAQQAPRPPAIAAPGEFTGGNAFLSTFKPGRLDVVASEVTVNAWLGEVRLDLVNATFVDRETTINVGGMMCDVRIRVPEGVDVNVSRLSGVMSETKVDGTRPRPDGIRVNLVGTVVMGEVTVLGPDTTKRNKYEKFVK
ncbi:Cell wall-active antibiotics response 4TMS YvqF [Tessaracoccus bendigoensis DSM 12906]|uniref:Cell wall-active antibiotics response 4TMS YvqF n=1 Tax=Tessaracoccus bendigoensis DSM 12906 TaxID=1123357 RepID=A0A1M6IZ77_9ACTN|nr:DUF1707 domain-containing protein [Tessaracoccus bendigoensis]SHJ39652.1 Cell wall-active antibiotics response 4TMS YvqF [Tessaracoccus bendigoensis DSM 12906]